MRRGFEDSYSPLRTKCLQQVSAHFWLLNYFPTHFDSGRYWASAELKMDISSWVHFIDLDTLWMEITLLRTVTLDS